MQIDADRWYDRETGGTFMGYWAESNVAVVTAMIPAGPRAFHERSSFLPDQSWQQAEIAKHYERSGRLDTYLGDWHTHPDVVSNRLSWTDRVCLKTIIKTPTARNQRPVMMLMCGKPGEWSLHSWFCQLRTKLFLFEFLDEKEATIEAYTSPSSETGEEIVKA
ncbi:MULTISPECIES: Mov34/MPN/PAD-1 family protein [unclassified Mesorhizobium]|nr:MULTISPECIES: Mov34/MPN/PAD-1 family protein [unclassified Mesorhizobium]WJI81063.1 Mov34/MPN/PAD-1 family protein [Mesorhizobium sp. C374B]WJI87603.1 Mov34/MPN/PAD-1 family protein [Mesorhizobium sp. C372A]